LVAQNNLVAVQS